MRVGCAAKSGGGRHKPRRAARKRGCAAGKPNCAAMKLPVGARKSVRAACNLRCAECNRLCVACERGCAAQKTTVSSGKIGLCSEKNCLCRQKISSRGEETASGIAEIVSCKQKLAIRMCSAAKSCKLAGKSSIPPSTRPWSAALRVGPAASSATPAPFSPGLGSISFRPD